VAAIESPRRGDCVTRGDAGVERSREGEEGGEGKGGGDGGGRYGAGEGMPAAAVAVDTRPLLPLSSAFPALDTPAASKCPLPSAVDDDGCWKIASADALGSRSL